MAHTDESTSIDKENYSNEENDLFFFESEHLALRGNKDYCELIKTIAILEAQRVGAIQDIDKIIDIQKSAVEDPLSFIQKLKNGEDLGIPTSQRIAEIPEIDWLKYGVPIPEEAFKSINQEKTEIIKEPIKELKIDKKSTHNQPWTSEEQKKLEELLVKFPPEVIEMRRYKKIAEALGNRTVKQVTSRVQKYFLKLYKAGLPIPGRIPKIADKKRSFMHKHQRHNSYLYKPSTFFPDLEVPVFMTENDDEDACNFIQPFQDKVNEEKDEVEIKINILKRIREDKERDKKETPLTHIGYKCDSCNEEPIIGSRWHCFDCKQESIDFCSDCMVSQINSFSSHPLTHNLTPIRNHIPNEELENPEPSSIKSEPISESGSDSSESVSSENQSTFCYYDRDYVSDTFVKNSGKYNYLDPNFLPE